MGSEEIDIVAFRSAKVRASCASSRTLWIVQELNVPSLSPVPFAERKATMEGT